MGSERHAGEEAPPGDDTALVAAIVGAAERALAAAWGGAVRLRPAPGEEAVRERSTVLRCLVEDGPGDAPASVIVKCPRTRQAPPYDLADLERESPAWRLLNEWAWARFAGETTGDPPLCARLYAGDRAAGVLVLEDLGEGEALADLLQGDDPARARAGLAAYATGLGRLHAATVGRAVALGELRATLGAPPAGAELWQPRFPTDNVPTFRAACAAVGLPLDDALERDLAVVAAAMANGGPFDAFSPGDTCPDNHRFAGMGVRFFDLELCGFRHALLDAAYLWLPFPTCWCVSRLPPGLSAELTTHYRAELARGCPAAANDAHFARALHAARAYWTVATVGWHMPRALAEDAVWGLATLRQRQILRLESLGVASGATGQLPALGAAARALATRLRQRWAADLQMPLYAAFRPAA